VPHGTNARLGCVTEVLIDDGAQRFLHTSDVEGPALEEQLRFILRSKPGVLFVDGPMTYMLGYRYSHENLQKAKSNLLRIIAECPLKALVLEHHLLRDLRYRERMPEVYVAGEKKGIAVQTAAEFAGKRNDMLEARRRELYERFPGKAVMNFAMRLKGEFRQSQERFLFSM
jgi:predicted metallo-beta-lactamase superfamily hydrolase